MVVNLIEVQKESQYVEKLNGKSVEVMLFASWFETFLSMSGLQVIHFCNNFTILSAEAVLADNFYIFRCGRFRAEESLLAKILEAGIVTYRDVQ